MGTSLRAFVVVASLLISSLGVRAQSGAASAKLAGQVSAAVAVSIPEAHILSGEAQVSTASINSNTTAVSISGSGSDEVRVSLRLQLRSNVGYGLQASFLSPDALALRLSVADLRATGQFVHPNALESVRLGEALAAPQVGRASLLTTQNERLPVSILSGSSISKAGTFSSSDNAIEVVLSIEIQSQSAGKPWATRLIISAAPKR